MQKTNASNLETWRCQKLWDLISPSLRQMQWIRNGQRKNGDADMAKTLGNYSSQDMQAVADYISRIKPVASKLAKSRDWKNPDFDANFVSAPWLRHKKRQQKNTMPKK